MRTTAEECAKLGKILVDKTNAYSAQTAIMLPTKAISVISAEGQSFQDKAADQALFDAIKSGSKYPVIEMDVEINDPKYARACAEKLMELIGKS
jgi:uncharacterized protein (UPF0261 family)